MCEIKDNKMTNLQQECFVEVDYSVKNIAVVKINRPEAKMRSIRKSVKIWLEHLTI